MDTKEIRSDSIISNFSVIFRLFVFHIKLRLRYPLNYISNYIELFFWVLIFFYAALAFGGGSDPNLPWLIAWGFFIYGIINSIMWSVGVGIRYDQMTGVLEQHFLSPMNELFYPLVKILRSIVIDIPLYMMIPVFFYMLVGGIVIKQVLLPLYVLMLAIISFAAFGYLLAGIMIHVKRAWAVVNMLQFIIMIFGGVFFPFSILPEQMLFISKLIPFAYYIDLFRTSIIGLNPELIPGEITILNFSLNPVLAELIIINITTAILLPISLLTYRISIRAVKKKGTLHMF